MRIVLLAAISCMLVGSVSGMENRFLVPAESRSGYAWDFGQGYALGSGIALPIGNWATSLVYKGDVMSGSDDGATFGDLGYATYGWSTALALGGVSMTALFDRAQKRNMLGHVMVGAGALTGGISTMLVIRGYMKQQNCKDT